MKRPAVILASRSPRRAELLSALGVPFRVVYTGCRENAPGLTPDATARALAWRKSQAVSKRLNRGIAISADTVVALNGKIYGKPRSMADARRQLSSLSGATHEVITAIVIIDLKTRCAVVGSELSWVTMKKLKRGEIARYVATREPMDKAGSYGIQGEGRHLISRMRGDYFNVVGFPLKLLARLGRRFGIRIPPTRLRNFYRTRGNRAP